MIKFIDGNIFDSKAEVIVNPVNCVGVMGAGLALVFKKKYPEMFRRYNNHCKNGRIKLGKVFLMCGNKRILLFPTKSHWAERTYVKNIESGLDDFVQKYKRWEIKSIAFPALGCGCGGAKWELVKEVIVEKLKNLDVLVEIYNPK